eukprot:SAG31_NODE_888_length_11219_cov_5.584712_2_plen_157_part_00
MNHCSRFTSFRRPELRLAYPAASITELAEMLGEEWREMAQEDKGIYERESAKEMVIWEQSIRKFNRQRDMLLKKLPAQGGGEFSPAETSGHEAHLFNKVVTIEDRPDQYFFVLTYIPDLQVHSICPPFPIAPQSDLIAVSTVAVVPCSADACKWAV